MRNVPGLTALSQATGVFLLGVALALGGTVAAHETSDFYNLFWSADKTWKIGNTYGPVANQAGWDSITASDNPWNGVSGAWFDFSYGGRDNSVTWTSNVCTMPDPGMWVVTHNTSTWGSIGRAYLCASSGRITRATIMLDDDANWYVLSGIPAANQYDLRSTAVHEFGHATGFFGPNAGHFLSNDPVCTTSPVHTMCAGGSPGNTYRRTLEIHEKELFAAAYN